MQTVKAYVTKHHLQFLQLLDTRQQAARMLSVPASPTTFIISRTGHLLGGGLGYRNWAGPEVQRLLESVLAEAKVEASKP